MSEGGTPHRLLVVDDDEDVRILVSRIFRDVGFEVDTAENGAEAIAMVAGGRYDLMLLDLMMPQVDGWGVLARLQGLKDAPTVVVLTARDDYDSFARAVKAGAAAHVVKPFRFQELVATCHGVLVQRQRPRSVAHERRQHPRRNLRVEIRVLSRDKAPLAVGELIDMSAGGAQVRLGVRLASGVAVDLAFQPPGGGGRLDLSGKIVWCRPEEGAFLHGVSFTELSPRAGEQLRDLLGPF
jgi:CheY-like chemotaxis protein